MRDLDRDVSNILQSFHGSFDPSVDQAAACTLLVDHLCMRRNKRCLLAYHRTRTDKLEEMVWSGSDIADLAAPPRAPNGGQAGAADLGHGEGNSSSLSPEEEEYVRQYSDLLAAYKGPWTDVDLTGSLEPPRDLFIDVRVLKDAGEIQTEYGLVATCTPSGSRVLRLIVWQHHKPDQELAVLRAAGRRGASHLTRIFAEAGLNSVI